MRPIVTFDGLVAPSALLHLRDVQETEVASAVPNENSISNAYRDAAGFVLIHDNPFCWSC